MDRMKMNRIDAEKLVTEWITKTGYSEFVIDVHKDHIHVVTGY